MGAGGSGGGAVSIQTRGVAPCSCCRRVHGTRVMCRHRSCAVYAVCMAKHCASSCSFCAFCRFCFSSFVAPAVPLSFCQAVNASLRRQRHWHEARRTTKALIEQRGRGEVEKSLHSRCRRSRSCSVRVHAAVRRRCVSSPAAQARVAPAAGVRSIAVLAHEPLPHENRRPHRAAAAAL